MALDRGVWSEREVGDWEACVATCYAMGLLYAGVTMPAPYTQAEREKLERVQDEPQSLGVTDAQSVLHYGVKLRPPSVTTIAAALARPGVGMCLTGRGSPGIQWQAGFTGLHEVFYVPRTTLAGDLYDPLAPMHQAPERIVASQLGAWVTGIGSWQAREIRANELAGGDMDITIRQYPGLRDGSTKGGTLVGYRLNPAPLTKSGTFAAGSGFHSDSEYVASPTPPGWPPGPYQRVVDGFYAGYLVANSQINLGAEPTGGGFTQDDLNDAYNAGVAAAEEAVEKVPKK